MRWFGVLLLACLSSAEPPDFVRIRVSATKGRIIPQSKGGGGFERSFRFTAVPGKSGRWIRQALEVRGTVFAAKGETTAVHLDVVEYYRVDASGRTLQSDSHYSQFWDHCGGDLTIRSRLTYGELRPRKRGDTIVGKSFILRSCVDADGEPVTMMTRVTRREIPAERGRRVEFRRTPGSFATRYAYRVRWDARSSRTQPSGEIGTGTWWVEPPEQKGPTVAQPRVRPIR